MSSMSRVCSCCISLSSLYSCAHCTHTPRGCCCTCLRSASRSARIPSISSVRYLTRPSALTRRASFPAHNTHGRRAPPWDPLSAGSCLSSSAHAVWNCRRIFSFASVAWFCLNSGYRPASTLAMSSICKGLISISRNPSFANLHPRSLHACIACLRAMVPCFWTRPSFAMYSRSHSRTSSRRRGSELSSLPTTLSIPLSYSASSSRTLLSTCSSWSDCATRISA